MEQIQFEKEICEFLNIPSIPLKEWNKKDSFKRGVAITPLALGNYAYAACTFDAEEDNEPRIIKTFANEPFYGIEKVFVIPNYMETDVSQMDLDEESRKKAEILAQEAKELTESNEEEEISEMKELPEWVFPEINSYEEAVAWLQNYYRSNKLKGKVPTNEETIKLRLISIWGSKKKKNK